ncbi:MAG: hypothetical protein H0S85_13055 [Desulfovibrionaceae bacterium]|jgi:hypothetical protein|nr:hypothetical protein [Desulfovibrionaceae bacterium]
MSVPATLGVMGGAATVAPATVLQAAAVLLVAGAAILAWFAHAHRAYLRALYQLYRHKNTPDQDDLMGRVLRKKLPLEVFVQQRDRLRFVCSALLAEPDPEAHDAAGPRLDIVYYKGDTAPRRGQLLIIFMPPQPYGEGQVNCIKGFVRRVEPRRLTLTARVRVEFLPRRTSKRYRVADQRLVRARLWFAAPADGPNVYAMLPPHFEINTDMHWAEGDVPIVDEARTLVSNVSVDGVGIRLPTGREFPDFVNEEKVCLHLALWDKDQQAYRGLWVAGVIRNIEADPEGNRLVGIQFTHQSSEFAELGRHCEIDSGYATEEGRLCWERVDERGGIGGVGDIIARF